MAEIVVKVNDVKKDFLVGSQTVRILKGITFDIEEGDFLVVFGPSGCGKSTLLHVLLGLEPPTEGDICYFGQTIYGGSSEDKRSLFRRKHVGMVYQQANWIKSLNVRENVSFPLWLLGYDKNVAFMEALRALKEVGMREWSEYMPSELSSGQQQRVALARALVNNPEVIVADEPTGNLDFVAGQQMMEILAQLTKQKHKTVIMVTHDLEYLKFSNRIVKMLDGSLQGVYTGEEKDKVVSGVTLKRGNTQADESAKPVDEASGGADSTEPLSMTNVPVPGSENKSKEKVKNA